MSIQRMRQRFAVHLRYALYVLIGVFIVGLPFVFAPGGLAPQEAQLEEGGADQDVIAEVNGSPVRRARLEHSFEQMMEQIAPAYASMGQGIGVDRLWRFRMDALGQAVLEELLLRQARSEGISVSRRETDRRARELVDEQLDQLKSALKGGDLEAALAEIIVRTEGQGRPRVSERHFRNWMTKRLLKESRDELHDDFVIAKLRQNVVSSTSATEQELLTSYDRVSVREILVGLQRPGKPERTPDEALKRAEELAALARDGSDFAELARAESDYGTTAASGGLRESVSPSSMPQEWREAVSGLKVGEVSKPIRVPSGYVIAKLESRKRELPEDFERNKESLLVELSERKRTEAWGAYQQKLRSEAKVKVTDAELLAYESLGRNEPEEALERLQQAARNSGRLSGAAAASVYYQLGKLLAARNEWEQAAEAYASSGDAVLRADVELPGARAEALLAQAGAHEHLGDVEEAILWYRAAGDASEVPALHQQLLVAYERVGRADLVQGEQDWLNDYEEAMRERQRAMEEQQRAMQEQQEKEASPAPPSEQEER
jgi:tetratricopeptide (TPR) repeat protein